MGIINRILGQNDEEPAEMPDMPEEDESGVFYEERVRGKITRVDPKGFGFITSMDIPYTRIFFHWSGLVQNTLNFKDLERGMTVEFNPLKTRDKGYRALRISVIQEPDLLSDN